MPPVLLLTYKRADTTQKVFEAIRSIKPTDLFVASNAARGHIEGEEKMVDSVRQLTEQVDWPCKVRRLYRDQHLNCQQSISTAIDWFFSEVEEGLILEDDCVPHPDFFKFAETMLSRYKDQKEVMMISGTSYLFDNYDTMKESYYFMRYFSIWGWATWRDRWALYDREMNEWPELRANGWLKSIFKRGDMARYFRDLFDAIANQQIDTWDYQWIYSCLRNNGRALVSGLNLVANIGNVGEHGASSDEENLFLNMKTFDQKEIVFRHSTDIDEHEENRAFDTVIRHMPFRWRLKLKLARLLG